ncbi:hypothetical protein BKA66DRAFT_26176 [Pyrenochaeta sp. MPI-SDFR-AT-0127]|nr:hypothetical protein BKA66DRAFT_26176 [Pyrenochaeta sp. MPI-SDFR-AT-0127]
MRFSIIAAVAAFSSTVLAQGLIDQIPKCAQTCFGSNLGTCGALDIGCICGNKAVINSVSCCVFATCSQSDIQKTIDFAVNLCRLNNIEVDTTPDCPSNGTSSANPSSPASSASGASGTPGASAASSASATASVTGLTGSQSPSATQASGTGAAASLQTAGAGLGLGMAMAGLVAFL